MGCTTARLLDEMRTLRTNGCLRLSLAGNSSAQLPGMVLIWKNGICWNVEYAGIRSPAFKLSKLTFSFAVFAALPRLSLCLQGVVVCAGPGRSEHFIGHLLNAPDVVCLMRYPGSKALDERGGLPMMAMQRNPFFERSNRCLCNLRVHMHVSQACPDHLLAFSFQHHSRCFRPSAANGPYGSCTDGSDSSVENCLPV
jgi:hypothetical protein